MCAFLSSSTVWARGPGEKAKNNLLGMDFVNPESEGLQLQGGGEESHHRAECSYTEGLGLPAKEGLS